jgi:cell division protein FtsB
MKKAIFILIVIVLLLIINGLIHSILDTYNKKDLLTQAQKELEEEKLKNSRLKAELTYVETEQFIEEQARNKLFLVKPGEEHVVIPQELIKSGTPNTKKPQIPNWQQWLKLFF